MATAAKSKVDLSARFDRTQVSNGGERGVDILLPYRAVVTVVGVAPYLFHGWNNEAVASKGKAAKGSKEKKEDDVESYVYRTESGVLGIATRQLAAAIREAGRYVPDPRSPRKSMRDLLKAAIVPLDLVSPFNPPRKEWDYLDKQRAVVQRNAITRTRPAMVDGWEVSFHLLVTLPEYVPGATLLALANQAGRLCGLGDYRPTFGRFEVKGFEVLQA